MPVQRGTWRGAAAKCSLALLLLLVADRLTAQTLPSEVGQTGASTIEFNRSSENRAGVEGKIVKGAYAAKDDLLAALEMSDAEFAKLSEEDIRKAFEMAYGLPADSTFELIIVDTPEEALFRGSVSPVTQRVVHAFSKYLDDNPAIEAKLMTRFEASGEFALNVAMTLFPDRNDPCFDVSSPAYSMVAERGPTAFFCVNNLKYIASLFATIAIAPLVERKYLPQGISPVMRLYNDGVAMVQPARRLDQDEPQVPCDIISYLYTNVKARAPAQCFAPTMKLQLAARNWFGSADGTWVMDVPFLFNALKRKELPLLTLKLRARSIEDSFYAFVLLHEIGHIVHGDLEQDNSKAEEKADRFAFDMMSSIPELSSEKLAIHPALQVYFMHLKTAIASNGGSKDAIAVIDERYRTSFRHYIEVEQANFEAASRNGSIDPKDLAYRRSEFCWTMHLQDDCEPKEALQRGVPPLPGP